MIKHTLKLIWNQKRKYMGILIEQTFVFIILMLCLTSLSDDMNVYLSPGQLDTKNTYAISFGKQVDRSQLPKIHTLLKKTKELPSVIAIASTTNILPYQNDGGFQRKDTLLVNGRKTLVHIKISDEAGFDVYKPDLEEGTWLTNQKQDDGSYPVVISRQLVEKAGWQNALGKQIQFEGFVVTVVGVISGMKYLALENSPAVMIAPLAIAPYTKEIGVRIKPGEEEAFVSDLYREFQKIFPNQEATLRIDNIDQWKLSLMFNFVLSFSLTTIPAFFLLIFAFIGTFGLFWIYSRKRRKEYALRLALGATKCHLIGFVLREGFIITLLSVLPGILLFCLVYEFTVVHFIALGTTLSIIFLFSIISVYIPAHQVSRINPAKTLHYE